MSRERRLLPLVASLVFTVACATSRPLPSEEGSQVRAPDVSQRVEPAGGLLWPESPPVLIRTLPEEQLRLTFPPPALHPELARLSVEEVRPLLEAFDALRPRSPLPLRLLEMPGGALSNRDFAASWESRLREDFFSVYGPPLLPVPESLETSRLLLALQLSTRYMDDGIREAARELFTAPAFLVSVSLAITVYFAAWLAPEPFFSKGLAAALTVRLALLVGLVELGRLAHAFLRLSQEAEAATSPQELEAASERFGKALGGAGLRVLVVVASLGMPQVLPKVPEGGLWTLLSPLRHAPAGGRALESIATAQVVADGSLIVTGVAAGTSATSLCGELATCMMTDGKGGASGGRSETLHPIWQASHTKESSAQRGY